MTVLLLAWIVIGLILVICERNNRKDAAITAALLPVLLTYAVLLLAHVGTGWLVARIDAMVDWIFD